MPFSGIFAGDTIQSITGHSGADVRGPISVGGDPGTLSNPVDGRTLTSLTLTNGSIIDAYVGETDSFLDYRNVDVNGEAPGGRLFGETVLDDPNDNPHFEIGQIKLKGNGGIIGSFIEGADIGPISITGGGFGFINSFVQSAGDTRFAGITADGYGIRDSVITGMSSVTNLIATGNGKNLDTRDYESSVLLGAGGPATVDPFTGTAPNELTDLYKYLGTSPKHPKLKSISASGAIQDVQVEADQDLDNVQAYQIRHRNALGSMTFSIGNQVGKINVLDGVDALTLKSGGLNQFTTGSDVANTVIGVSGPIKSINVGGTLRGTSFVQAMGTGRNPLDVDDQAWFVRNRQFHRQHWLDHCWNGSGLINISTINTSTFFRSADRSWAARTLRTSRRNRSSRSRSSASWM